MFKMRYLVLAAALVPLCFPADASAQGSTKERFGGAKGTDWGKVADKKAPVFSLTSGDLEKISPLKMLLGKKKDLKLTDAQTASFTDANDKLMASNAERFQVVEEFRKASRMATSDPSADELARNALTRESAMQAIADIRLSYDAASKIAVESMEAEQQAIAAKLLEKHDEDVQKSMTEKMGGMGGRGGARPRGRG